MLTRNLISTILIAVISIAIYYVKVKHFQVLPHEKGLDYNSFFIAKLSKVLIKDEIAVNFHEAAAEIPKGRLLFHSFLRVFEFIDFVRDRSLLDIPVLEVKITVPASYQKDESNLSYIRARVYNYETDKRATGNKKPVLIWYHGGGWSKGSMEHDHSMCLKFAKELDYVVVNVDYRMAPEYIYPTAIEDAYLGFQWVLGSIYDYGGDDNQIILGGESAGGNLASAVMSKYLQEVALEGGQITSHPVVGLYLVYPALDYYSDPNEPANVLYGTTNGILTLAGTENARITYAGTTNMEVRKNFLYAPLLTPKELLQHYPPTVFVLAKYDVLTEESLRLNTILKEFSIPTKVLTYDSTIHGFFGRELISPAGPVALTESTKELSKLMKRTSFKPNNRAA